MSHQTKIVLYALSTCVWCRKTKRLLNQLGVDYTEIDVDLLTGREQSDAVANVVKYNGSESYPVMVIDNKKVICGFNEPAIREVLS